MIRVTVMYPKQDGGTFDYDYYLKNHMQIVKNKIGGALKKIEVGKGLGAPGGAPETYVTVANLFKGQNLRTFFGLSSTKLVVWLEGQWDR